MSPCCPTITLPCCTDIRRTSRWHVVSPVVSVVSAVAVRPPYFDGSPVIAGPRRGSLVVGAVEQVTGLFDWQILRRPADWR